MSRHVLKLNGEKRIREDKKLSNNKFQCRENIWFDSECITNIDLLYKATRIDLSVGTDINKLRIYVSIRGIKKLQIKKYIIKIFASSVRVSRNNTISLYNYVSIQKLFIKKKWN